MAEKEDWIGYILLGDGVLKDGWGASRREAKDHCAAGMIDYGGEDKSGGPGGMESIRLYTSREIHHIHCGGTCRTVYVYSE